MSVGRRRAALAGEDGGARTCCTRRRRQKRIRGRPARRRRSGSGRRGSRGTSPAPPPAPSPGPGRTRGSIHGPYHPRRWWCGPTRSPRRCSSACRARRDPRLHRTSVRCDSGPGGAPRAASQREPSLCVRRPGLRRRKACGRCGKGPAHQPTTLSRQVGPTPAHPRPRGAQFRSFTRVGALVARTDGAEGEPSSRFAQHGNGRTRPRAAGPEPDAFSPRSRTQDT